jgi:hypothetical protein
MDWRNEQDALYAIDRIDNEDSDLMESIGTLLDTLAKISGQFHSRESAETWVRDVAGILKLMTGMFAWSLSAPAAPKSAAAAPPSPAPPETDQPK